jgi:pimeloyl-ACP methyl ester carboxylesterase
MATLETSIPKKGIEYLHSDVPKKEEQSRKIDDKILRPIRFYFQTVGRIFPKRAAERAYQLFVTPRKRAKHFGSDALIESAVVSSLVFRGETIKLYSWGKSERIVLLAHGWESRGTALRPYVPALLAAGFRVVAFDSMAHGDSSGKINNLPTNAATMVAIYEHLQPEGNIEAAICHSFGCSSLIFALQFLKPDWQLRRLAMVAVPHSIRHILDHYTMRLWIPRATKKHFEGKLEALTNQKIDNLDVENASTSVKVEQLLLIHDQQDNVTSPQAAIRVFEKWAQAKLLMTDGYGHFRIAKNKDVVAKVVSFIEC